MPNTAFPAADQQHLIYGISETRVFSAQEPAPWMPATNTDVVIAVHESAAAAEHHLAERQRLRALYSGGGRGSNDFSHETFRVLHAMTFTCERCGGLVDYLASCRATPASTGCAGRGCSASHRMPAYAVGQTRMAVALMLGTRCLVERPAREQRMTVMYGRAYTLQVACATLHNALHPLCANHAQHPTMHPHPAPHP